MIMAFIKILFCFISIQSFEKEYISPFEYFGDSYKSALNFCRINKEQIISELKEREIDPSLAMAIVFPELIRYDRFKDYFETRTLEKAYVYGGKETSDFSIGYFQMKPSFIETIEKAVLSSDSIMKHKYYEIVRYIELSDVTEARKIRIQRLKNLNWQLNYLACFVSLESKKLEHSDKRNIENELRILSTAYNSDFYASLKKIDSISNRKTFPNGIRHPGRFSYAEVSLYFYNHHAKTLFN
jgi:hypothetical protein